VPNTEQDVSFEQASALHASARKQAMPIAGADSFLEDRINPFTPGVVPARMCGCQFSSQRQSLDNYLADVYVDGGVIEIDSRSVGAVWHAGTGEGMSKSRLRVEIGESAVKGDDVSGTETRYPSDDTDMPPYVDIDDFPWTPRCTEDMPRALAVEKRGGCGDEFLEFASSGVRKEYHWSGACTGSQGEA
jgi:hypothetical protein